MKELLRQIGIDLPGYYSKPDTYVIDLDSADDYSRMFAKLDKTDLVDEVEESSIVMFLFQMLCMLMMSVH